MREAGRGNRDGEGGSQSGEHSISHASPPHLVSIRQNGILGMVEPSSLGVDDASRHVQWEKARSKHLHMILIAARGMRRTRATGAKVSEAAEAQADVVGDVQGAEHVVGRFRDRAELPRVAHVGCEKPSPRTQGMPSRAERVFPKAGDSEGRGCRRGHTHGRRTGRQRFGQAEFRCAPA